MSTKAHKQRYAEWTRIPWDGNPELHLECWRKSFGRGHVSVGIGEFTLIVYSHGANSHESLSGTRWNYEHPALTEAQAMQLVDLCGGYHDHKRETAFRGALLKTVNA